MNARHAAFAALGAGLCFGAVEWAAEQLQRDYSAWQVIWTRYGVHLALIGAAAAARGVNPLRTARPGLQVLRSMLMVTMPGCFLIGAHYAPAPGVWSLFWITLLLSAWPESQWRGADVWRRGALHLGALAGMWLVVQPLHALRWPTLAPGLAMGASFAGYLALTHVLRAETAFSRLFYTALGVFVVLTPFVAPRYLLPSGHDWLVFLFIAVFGLACLYLLDLALDAVPAALVSPYLLITPAAAAVLGVRDGGRLSAASLLGVVLLAACLWRAVPRAAPALAQRREA